MSEDEGDIQIRLATGVMRGNYLRDLAISDTAINEALRTQPSRYVFWAKMVSLQRAMVEKKKMEMEQYEGELYTFLRAQSEREGAKPTEKSIEAAMRRDSQRREKLEALLTQKLKLDHLTAIQTAFSQRKDMLMSLAANLRQEFDTVLDMKEKQFIEQRMKRTAETVIKGETD